MQGFVERQTYLDRLVEDLAEVRRTGTARFVAVRGRRRVGKSRLLQEFVSRAGVPHVFFQASKQPLAEEVALLTEELGRSSLPVAEAVRSGATFNSWTAAIGLIASQATRDDPAIVVIDEFPYLVEQGGQAVEGEFQKLYDRHLDGKAPVLLIVVGSDLSMMESLDEYGRPLHGRPTRTLEVSPFSPAEVQDLLGVTAAQALDAYLVAGGFPLVSQSWRPGSPVERFLQRALDDPTSPLIVDAERMLRAEFPGDVQAREVLSAIGSGERTFTGIGRAAGIQAASLSRSLEILRGKRVISARRPVSTKPSKETRYAVADPYLRFWLRFIEPNLDRIERGQGRHVAADVIARWKPYRGTAIEPIVREAVARMLGSDPRFGRARQVGGWWNRTSTIEVDLVGATRGEVPKHIAFVGSIKWRANASFERHDTNALVEQRRHVAGADRARLVGVSRQGFADAALDVEFGPDDVVRAWHGTRHSEPEAVRSTR